MTAYNVVRFKVKPGREQEFLDVHRRLERDFPVCDAVGSSRPATGRIASSASGTPWRASRRHGR